MRTQRFPEIERGSWFALSAAKDHVVKSQVPVIEALAEAPADSA